MSISAADMYQRYLQYESDLLQGKTLRIGDRFLTHHDLPEVRAGRQEWEQKAAAEAARSSGRSARRPFQVVV